MRFYEMLDQAVKEADGRDASDFAIPGFPYLRANRFIAGLKTTLHNDARRKQWVRWMRQLDLAARRKEIQNLPVKHLKALNERLGETADRNMLMQRVKYYSKKLSDHDWRQPGFYPTLQAAITAPSEYSTAMRVVGIYPLTSIPVASVTRRVQDQFKQWHATPADELEVRGNRIAYGPPAGPAYSELVVRLIL
ncbi:MAG: hypothetical protein GY850_28495 [bacterium]|nr:hypothetical protein [bacterium]